MILYCCQKQLFLSACATWLAAVKVAQSLKTAQSWTLALIFVLGRDIEWFKVKWSHWWLRTKWSCEPFHEPKPLSLLLISYFGFDSHTKPNLSVTHLGLKSQQHLFIKKSLSIHLPNPWFAQSNAHAGCSTVPWSRDIFGRCTGWHRTAGPGRRDGLCWRHHHHCPHHHH